MNLQVRQALETDAEAIAALKTRSWQTAYRGQLPDRFLDDLSLELASRIDYWRVNISTQSSAKHEIWTAECDGDLRAFAAFGPARRSDEAGFGEIYALYVDPRHWNKGVGKSLLAHSVERLSRDYATAILWVLATNVRARHVYERAGWALDGGAKIESLPDSTELREVRYRVSCTSVKRNHDQHIDLDFHPPSDSNCLALCSAIRTRAGRTSDDPARISLYPEIQRRSRAIRVRIRGACLYARCDPSREGIQ